MEMVLLALLEQQRDNPTFWDRVEQFTARLHSDLAKVKSEDVNWMADAAQDYLDTWRSVTGPNPKRP